MKCGKWCRPHYHYQLQEANECLTDEMCKPRAAAAAAFRPAPPTQQRWQQHHQQHRNRCALNHMPEIKRSGYPFEWSLG
ncbi:hypothetical protein AWZ03_007992 [Drosophila navojoa]|uniref:Uncharacterized protein n=1 Tax=Drosophila navojoa TaxID=7232 RepID=A0A484BCQ9_DRONA|nr:hypothetical protein AWZ03_007992 [Drosophila navojoa]